MTNLSSDNGGIILSPFIRKISKYTTFYPTLSLTDQYLYSYFVTHLLTENKLKLVRNVTFAAHHC
jgi:hypothetical protein